MLELEQWRKHFHIILIQVWIAIYFLETNLAACIKSFYSVYTLIVLLLRIYSMEIIQMQTYIYAQRYFNIRRIIKQSWYSTTQRSFNDI